MEVMEMSQEKAFRCPAAWMLSCSDDQKFSCSSLALYALHVSGDNEKKQSIRRCTALFIRRKAGGPANEIKGPPLGGQQQQEQTEPVKGTVYYIKAIITNYELPVVLAVAVMVITVPLTLRALIQMVKKIEQTDHPYQQRMRVFEWQPFIFL